MEGTPDRIQKWLMAEGGNLAEQAHPDLTWLITKDPFIQRFLIVRNAVITVIWSIMQDLEGVEPPAESTAPKSR